VGIEIGPSFSAEGYNLSESAVCLLWRTNHIRNVGLTENVYKENATLFLSKVKQFLLHMWHPSCYCYYKPDDKS